MLRDEIAQNLGQRFLTILPRQRTRDISRDRGRASPLHGALHPRKLLGRQRNSDLGCGGHTGIILPPSGTGKTQRANPE
jgi:hypothetical protein